MKSGPVELAYYHTASDAERRRIEKMTHTPAPPWEQLGISEEEFNQRQKKVEAIAAAQHRPGDPSAENTAQFPSISDPDPIREAALDAEIERKMRRATRKLRSDKGVQRGPKAPGEPEAAATTETVSISVELTAVQYADLEREAARVYRDIEPRYLTTEPAVVLLNSRVQKHWRTLVGK
jgi:hypothetical protein